MVDKKCEMMWKQADVNYRPITGKWQAKEMPKEESGLIKLRESLEEINIGYSH